jgi:hypothetical protein
MVLAVCGGDGVTSEEEGTSDDSASTELEDFSNDNGDDSASTGGEDPSSDLPTELDESDGAIDADSSEEFRQTFEAAKEEYAVPSWT